LGTKQLKITNFVIYKEKWKFLIQGDNFEKDQNYRATQKNPKQPHPFELPLVCSRCSPSWSQRSRSTPLSFCLETKPSSPRGVIGFFCSPRTREPKTPCHFIFSPVSRPVPPSPPTLPYPLPKENQPTIQTPPPELATRTSRLRWRSNNPPIPVFSLTIRPQKPAPLTLFLSLTNLCPTNHSRSHLPFLLTSSLSSLSRPIGLPHLADSTDTWPRLPLCTPRICPSSASRSSSSPTHGCTRSSSIQHSFLSR